MNRCKWCLCNDKMIRYHDEEWGVPLRDDRKQFEFLMMEVMQCGLNWNMMIQKREIFRQCFENFDFDKVAEYQEADIERILNAEGMIRSRRKIEAVIHNADVFRRSAGNGDLSADISGALPKKKLICIRDIKKERSRQGTAFLTGSARI